jgi:ATP-dependent DNA helicase RecG
MKAQEKREALEAIENGEATLIIGTHALISDQTVFHDLGLVVIDEQHRFGVRQRLILGQKGKAVDVLLMTATPIPRTLAMTAYGDLNTSILDEKPANRQPIVTTAMPIEKMDDIIERLKTTISTDKRAYWICPLIEESDVLDIAAAEERFTYLSAALPECQPVLVHGRMKTDEREDAMEQFRTGQSQLLIATTVIEVGVDIPEASIMIIESAERFGLAQLHQLRGRVGRGAEKSSCVLLYNAPISEVAKSRLNIMRETNDGFRIASEDLRLRGPGEVLGRRQSGDPEFMLADLAYHDDLLAMAHDYAQDIIAKDPMLDHAEHEAMRILMALFERDKAVTYLAGG